MNFVNSTKKERKKERKKKVGYKVASNERRLIINVIYIKNDLSMYYNNSFSYGITMLYTE